MRTGRFVRATGWPVGRAVGLALGLSGLAASLAFAGPGLDGRRALTAQTDEGRDRTGATERLVRETRALLAPLLGDARPALLSLVADPARFTDLATKASEPDATVFADFERRTLVARDLDVDPARARLVVHEATKLQLATVLGARPAPWLEEGLACCAEDAWWQSTSLGAERPDGDRAARARHELRSGALVAPVFALAAPSFERGEHVHRDVALAWTATRHLLQGGSRGRRALAAYTETLRATGSPVGAARAFESVLPLADLERALGAYAR